MYSSRVDFGQASTGQRPGTSQPRAKRGTSVALGYDWRRESPKVGATIFSRDTPVTARVLRHAQTETPA